MQQDVRGQGDAALSGEGTLPIDSGGERPTGLFSAAGPSVPPSVAGVPSEQLWRAAVIAAREAAMTAAELRRSFEARRRGA